jgi:hypothetical protein
MIFTSGLFGFLSGKIPRETDSHLLVYTFCREGKYAEFFFLTRHTISLRKRRFFYKEREPAIVEA